MKKYETLAEQIRHQIENDIWKAGEKLPSLRRQVALSNMSLMTVMHAYQLLESQGWIISQPRSGYIVAPKAPMPESHQGKIAVAASESVDINDFIFDVLQKGKAGEITNLGYVYPDPSLYPKSHVNKVMSSTFSSMPTYSALDNFPPGNQDLRSIIAKRYAAQGIHVNPDEIVITAGALEALNLSLQAVTQPGDWVVIEAPAFYGALQALQRLNLRALSVRTDPKTGIDIEALANALNRHQVKACWLMTNHQNPTGFTMPEQKKKQLTDLLAKHKVYLIEDDVYSEMYFGNKRPLPAKAFDKHGLTMHCSSFSKTLMAGYRIGWVAAGQMAKTIQKLQLMSTLSVSAPIQLALAKYLATRNYESHLRQTRKTLEQRKYATWKCIQGAFPKEVKTHYAEGGYFLWIELPEHLNATELYQHALANNISFTPGKMFALDDQFAHCLRINASFQCTGRVEQAINKLGELIQSMLNNS